MSASTRWLARIEQGWEAARRRRRAGRAPEHFRIESYGGHAGPAGLVLRARVLDDPVPDGPVEGEGWRSTLRRTVRHFRTHELPGVPLRLRIGGVVAETVSDAEGYVRVVTRPAPAGLRPPRTVGILEVSGEDGGLIEPYAVPVEVLVPSANARFGVVSDVDDTILETGVQRLGLMLRRTFLGSVHTRSAFAGAAALYRDLADGRNPFFYVSSSPWNLHGFLEGFVAHHDFPLGPLLLRDLLGDAAGREPKHGRIQEVLDLHPDLPFVLVGDSGEKDPQIYADIVATNPGRVLAVLIREVRLDPGDGRVEGVLARWPSEVPFRLVADSAQMRREAEALRLLP